MQPTRIEQLQQMPIFGAIRESSLRLVLEYSRVVEVASGEMFFRESDPASTMFVLEFGRVQVFKSWQGREVVLHDLGVGDCFGEMALMDLLPRSASVRAVADCRAIEFGATDLMHLYERDAAQFALVQMNIGREVCRRLRVTNDLLFRAKLGDALPPTAR
jgi:CRP-like cAMP-binding protein